MSVSLLVNSRLSRMKRGTPFPIERFYSLGSVTAVQKVMSRLAKRGQVIRVAKGIYSRPKPLTHIPSLKIAAKAEDVATTWAKANHYRLVPQGLESAYRLGLQSQAPLQVIYWSSGPSRVFKVGNQEVQVKHTADFKLRWPNKPEGELLRGLMFASPKHTSEQQLRNAFNRLNISDEEKLLVVNKLLKNTYLSEWRQKLSNVKRSLVS